MELKLETWVPRMDRNVLFHTNGSPSRLFDCSKIYGKLTLTERDSTRKHQCTVFSVRRDPVTAAEHAAVSLNLRGKNDVLELAEIMLFVARGK